MAFAVTCLVRFNHAHEHVFITFHSVCILTFCFNQIKIQLIMATKVYDGKLILIILKSD